MKNISLIVIVLSSIIISCSSPKSLDNTYYGFLPCADCIGISYELTLKPDQTYLSKSVYEGKPKSDTFTEEGEYSIENDSILVLAGENDSTHYIIKSSEKLVQLNHEGKTIQSNFSSQYELTTDPINITERIRLNDIWALQTIDGDSLDASIFPRGIPVIEFHLAEKRVMGNSGCNSFNGNFEWTGKKLTFGPLMSTRMLCAQADSIETKIMGTLSDKMINYKLEGLKLTISDGETSLVYKKVD